MTRKVQSDGRTARIIRGLRETYGWERRELADKLDRADPTERWTETKVVNLELNRKTVSPETLRALIDVFEVDADYLLFGPVASLRRRVSIPGYVAGGASASFRPRPVDEGTDRPPAQLDLDTELAATAMRRTWKVA